MIHIFNRNFKVTLITLCSLLVFTGCNNLFQQPNIHKPEEGKGFLCLSFNGIRTGRTILPRTENIVFPKYKLVFTSGTEEIIEVLAGNDLHQPIPLPIATWNLVVTAYIDNEMDLPGAYGELPGIAITGGITINKDLVLQAIMAEGTGTFRWNINYPENIASASMTITPLDDETGTPEKTWHFTGGTDPDTIANKNNSNAPLELNTGYYCVVFTVNNGEREVIRTEYLHVYKNMESYFEGTFHFGFITVTSGADTVTNPAAGTLRRAIADAQPGGMIIVGKDVRTINLAGRLPINKNLVIDGNGVTLTRAASWTASDMNSQLLTIAGSNTAVHISRVHFKDGLTNYSGAAIYKQAGTLTLESCIFSGNKTTSIIAEGGAIYNTGLLIIRGCTFYGNSTGVTSSGSSYGGGAIFSTGTTSSVILTGNLFINNTSGSYPVVRIAQGTVTSGGYNVANAALGTGSSQAGWAEAAGDKSITVGGFFISPLTFRVLDSSEAVNVVSILPENYPTADFYGTSVNNGAIAGAVQGLASGDYFIDITYDSTRGSVEILPEPNADGLFAGGDITLTAAATEQGVFSHWVVNGDKQNKNPLTITLNDHACVQAVFQRVVIVTSLSDATGSASNVTLRYAVTNAQEGDFIRFQKGLVTPGKTALALTSRLVINRSMTIDGGGIILTRAASWTVSDISSQLLNIPGSSTVNIHISRVHFRGGETNNYGAAIYKQGGTLTLESCIFSRNMTSSIIARGGAIYNTGILIVRGCTFYENSTGATSSILSLYGGAAVYSTGITSSLTLTGNLFFGNTSAVYPVICNDNGTVTSGGYNVVDVPLGTGSAQAGWTGISSDKSVPAGFVNLPISPMTFAPISSFGAENVIASLPDDYPAVDFYGETIEAGAAAGAVQGLTNGFYYLELITYHPAVGTVQVTGSTDEHGTFYDAMTFTAIVTGNGKFSHWTVNGERQNGNTLTIITTEHTRIQAIFQRFVNVTSSGDTNTLGTLRHALNNAYDWDLIRINLSAPNRIELTSTLPLITRSISIEGNGVTLTRSAGWTTTVMYDQLLVIPPDYAPEVNLSRIHFRDGLAASFGAAISNNDGFLTLESCIFSGNQTTDNMAFGSAIFNGGNMIVKGCTFYGNSSPGALSALSARVVYGGANSTLVLTGNLFYGNTFGASASPMAARILSGGTVTSGGYNVVDVPLGTGSAQAGWTAHGTDRTFAQLGITGTPFDTTSFESVTTGTLHTHIPSAPEGFPPADFNGETRSWPGAPGAVK